MTAAKSWTVETLHDCTFSGVTIRHTTPWTADTIHRPKESITGTRITGTRCDGTRIEVWYDAATMTTDGHPITIKETTR